ncbi:hypothetical protein [Aquihabitans sp. McL0605]|uniref:hypothetical protein n=1 Tax=Aquihabitans sp. McL0605 TaxID=3415671 RepID=UPI003CEA4AE3
MQENRWLPSGTVTFVMTDVEGSTSLWEQHADLAGAVIEQHDTVLEAAVDAAGGFLLKAKGEGDSTFSVFGDAADALAAGVAMHRGLAHQTWPRDLVPRIRTAVYTGEAERRDGDYHGVAANRGGRLRGTAHGGQLICSQATEEQAHDRLPKGISLRDLGLHRLRDIATAEHVYQVVHPDLPDEFPPLRSLGVRQNLPSPRTTLVGREADVLAVAQHLVAGRLVTLTGVGGCGKTRLAIAVACEQLERFPDGVFFVDLAPLAEGSEVPGAVAAAVGFTRMALGTGSGVPAHELLDFLASRSSLLVIDNCEHVVDAAAELVDELLERCPGVSVLATSREALDIDGEQTVAVSTLAVDHGDAPAGLPPAARLFCDRAVLAQADLVFSAQDERDVEELCRHLDGIPLAIELAAAQAAHLSPREILDRLDDRFPMLAAGRRRHPRQRTLHATLDWSHDLLSDDERTVLRRLAAFPGTFSHASAEAVCGSRGLDDSLRSLVHKSLLVMQHDDDHGRYRLLETVRAYAEEKLVEADEETFARDCHRDHFLTWAEAIPASHTLLDPQGVIRREHHNLMAALQWSETGDRADLIARLAGTMNRIWLGDIGTGRRWLALGVVAADDLEPEQRVRVLTVDAHIAVVAMQAAEGVEVRQAAAAAGDEPGLWSSFAVALLCLNTAIHAFQSKDPDLVAASHQLGEKAVELAPDDMARGLAWFWVGQARILTDDIDGALEALAEGSLEVIPGGDMSPVALALYAGLLHVVGRHREALAAATDVFERAKTYPATGLWAWTIYCSLPFALEQSQHGRHAEASSFMRELLEDGGALQTPGVMTSVVVVLGAMAWLRGDWRSAGLLLEVAGRAMIEGGIRTPLDIVLYSHYEAQVKVALPDEVIASNRTVAAEMTIADAIALGLGGGASPQHLVGPRGLEPPGAAS